MTITTNDIREERLGRLRALLAERVLVVDGAMGTRIQALGLNADDFGGAELEGCNEYLNITRPDAITGIHRDFLNAGADIIETNTFGSTPLVLGEYDLADRAEEISRIGAEIARAAADEAATDEHPRFVAGSMGPTTRSISVTANVTFDELVEHFRVQARGLITGGVDVLLVETSQDALNIKAALEGIDRANADLETGVPAAVQCTIETMGTLLAGQDIEAFYTSFAHRDLLWIGMNCATGPEFMRDYVRTLSQISRFPVAVIPNAGLPDEDGNYHETPDNVAATLASFIDAGWVNIIGGCCGTVDEHIERMCAVTANRKPRTPVETATTVVSGLEALTIDEDTKPVLIGERTNVLGSRRFKRLIGEGSIEEASEIGRDQVRNGAHALDVCLQDPDRDEVADITVFLERLVRKTRAPLVIDSTDVNVIEEALKRTQGKSIINSINLEDGEERFAAVAPLARRYGAAVIVGCIDDDREQAQAITRERKLEIARRSYQLLTEKYGLRGEDIIFDALTFPVGTGDENYIGSAVETIEGIRLIKEALPLAKTTLGISNVSFGLPQAGREALNAVMLYHCVQAGLDSAIVNTGGLVRYAALPDEERALCDDLIFWRGDDPIAAFAAHYRNRQSTAAEQGVDRLEGLSLDERIARRVVEGTREGMTPDLDVALDERPPLEIINGPLMAGMDEVGRLFAANELIVAEVLESAEVMKAAVAHLEPHMETTETSSRGKILLATVKGDVHDIGKNLVDIILSNNGYRVINRGIKVPPGELIEAFQEHRPDLIGLSGLLVKSAQMMVETVRDFTEAGVDVPILVGGAALSNRFTRLRIAPEYGGLVAYAQDAMTGLDLANRIRSPEDRQRLETEIASETERLDGQDTGRTAAAPADERQRAVVMPVDAPPRPPDLLEHTLLDHDLDEVFSYINPTMLYVRHLGYRGRFLEDLENGNERAVELHERVQRIQREMASRPDIRASAVFRFFRAGRDGDDVLILTPDGEQVLERLQFGRQAAGEGLSLADYVRADGAPDYLGAFVTTVGPGVRALADEWKDKGEYLDSHILQVLALEGAEGFAELLHQRMRAMWGLPDPEGITKPDLFRAAYTGKRYSFGYPACPRLEDQEILWRLLNPTDTLGVNLTEEMMMEPEGSVSALVFHHPQAKYFNLSNEDAERLERRIEESVARA